MSRLYVVTLFNLYAEYIIRNTGLDGAQAGIKIAGRSSNNLRYADDTTLMAESEEDLKSLLMKVREERDKGESSIHCKASRISQQKAHTLHEDNTRLHISLTTRQKLLVFGWEVLIHPLYPQILHLRMSIYFGLYKFISMEKISISWKTVKGTWNSYLLKKIKSFGKMEV